MKVWIVSTLTDSSGSFGSWRPLRYTHIVVQTSVLDEKKKTKTIDVSMF